MTKRLFLAIFLGTTILAGTAFGQDSTSLSPDTAVMDMKQALMLRPVVVPVIGTIPAYHFIFDIDTRGWLTSFCLGFGKGWEAELAVHNRLNTGYRAVQPILRYRWPADDSSRDCLFGTASYSHPVRNAEREGELSLGCARRVNDTYRLFADVIGGYPASIAVGGGFNRHTDRSVTDLALGVRAHRDRGVPVDIRFGYRVRLWRALFIEARDRATFNLRRFSNYGPIYDQNSGTLRFEEQKSWDLRIEQDQIVCLGFAL